MQPRPDPEPETTGPVDRDERLGEAIEAYLERAEANGPADPEEFAQGYPDLSDDLVAALEGLALVQGLVGEVNGPGHRLEEGRRVAGYRIVRELGRGGMGIVYEAVHVGLDRPVALKVLGTQAAPDSSGRRRFLNEAKTAAGLHHTHIVPVFDVGQVGGLCYYAMQRIEGSGLDRVLRVLRRDRSVAAGSSLGTGSKKSPNPAPASPGIGERSMARPVAGAALAASGLGDETMSWRGNLGGGSAWRGPEPVDDPPTFTPPRGSAYYRWVADVGRQAAEALGHAHLRGVIHRDIKPSNLLVDARGMIWVADFGLARRLADPSQTQFDSLMGTPRYMSPEQARTGALDGRSDVYSLGATLYELITLRPPFDGQSVAELIEQIKTREPVRPRRFDPRVPLDLETILLKALAKRPDDRYATADALAEDLARFLAHEPVKARRIGPIGRAVRFARRHPSLTAVSTTASALVISTATFAYVRVLDAASAAREAQGRTELANGRLQVADRQLRAAMLTVLEQDAANALLSNDANRRTRGLASLGKAAAMSPDPAARVKLRDQALAFLSMRGVEARPAIETIGRHQQGLTFVPNGRRIVALSDSGELETWDLAGRERVDSTEMPIAPPRNRPQGGRGGRGYRPGDPRIASAGDQIAVVAPEGSAVRFFDPALPEVPAEILPIKGQTVAGVLASANGRRLLVAGRASANGYPGPNSNPNRPPDGPEELRITLWDRDRPQDPRASLTPPASKLDQPFGRDRFGPLLAIAPDGSKVAAARFFESEVALWDGEGRPLPPIDVQVNATALAIGPTGLLAVAGNGGEIAIWDLSPTKPARLQGLVLHQSFVSLLRFNPSNGSILAAAGMGGGVELWDLAMHSPIAALPTREAVSDLAFSADGLTLAAGQSSSLASWSIIEPVGQHALPESGTTPRGLAFGPGDLLAIASVDATQAPAPLRLWGGPGICPPSVRAWDQARASSVGFDAQGRLIDLEADAIRWFRPPGPDPVEKFELPQDERRRPPDRKGEGSPSIPVRFAARTPDGRTLLLSRASSLSLWRADAPDTLEPLALPDPPQGYLPRVAVAALHPDGSTLFHLAHRGEVLHARPIGPDAASRKGWTLPVGQGTTLTVSPDGRTLAVAERSGSILLIDTASGLVRSTLPPAADDAAGPGECLAFSPDGRTLAVGAREQVRLWDVAGPPHPLVRLPGHRGAVRSLSFDAASRRLAAADEKAVKVWDLGPLRAELARLGIDW